MGTIPCHSPTSPPSSPSSTNSPQLTKERILDESEVQARMPLSDAGGRLAVAISVALAASVVQAGASASVRNQQRGFKSFDMHPVCRGLS